MQFRLTRGLIVGALAFAATFLFFSPALEYGFLNWDDFARVVDDVSIRRLDCDSIYSMFTSLRVSNYTPLERLSCALDYALWGPDPFGFHGMNILLHSLNAALVSILACKLFRIARASPSSENEWEIVVPALASALAFGLHPLRVESVVWISERRDVLALFFLLLCVLAYLESAGPRTSARGRAWFRWTAWFLFAGSLLSKATGVTLPLVLLLIDFYPLRRFEFSRKGFRCVLEKTPYFALSLAVGWIAIEGQLQQGAMIPLAAYPWTARIANAWIALVFYAQQWIWPRELSPFYASFSPSTSLASPIALESAAWLCLVSAVSLAWRRRMPGWTVIWWSYLVMILPFTGLLQAGNPSAADRYTYFPGVALALFFGGACGLLFRDSVPKFIRGTGCAVFSGILWIWAGMAIRQMPVWRSSLALWEYTLQKVPQESLALHNYSSVLVQNGEFYRAAVFARATTRANPHWDVGWHNYGVALSLSGRKEEAIRAFERSLRLNPATGDTHFALGNLLFLKGDFPGARRHYFASIQDGPTPERLTHLGMALDRAGQTDLGLKYLSRAAMGKYPKAYVVWAQILVNHGRRDDARKLLRFGGEATGDSRLRELEVRLSTHKTGVVKDDTN